MKTNYLLLVVLCTVYASTAIAQDEEKKDKINFGVKAGANYTNVWDSEGDEFRADAKMGFAGGVYLSIPVVEFLGVQPEVMISQKGFQATGTLLTVPYAFTRVANFIDIPLLLQLRPAPFLNILAGPQFSYLLNRKDTYTFGSNSEQQKKEFDNDNVRKNILGIALGIDGIIDHFLISARASADLQSNNGDGTSQTPRYKNQVLQLTVGYQF